MDLKEFFNLEAAGEMLNEIIYCPVANYDFVVMKEHDEVNQSLAGVHIIFKKIEEDETGTINRRWEISEDCMKTFLANARFDPEKNPFVIYC